MEWVRENRSLVIAVALALLANAIAILQGVFGIYPLRWVPGFGLWYLYLWAIPIVVLAGAFLLAWAARRGPMQALIGAVIAFSEAAFYFTQVPGILSQGDFMSRDITLGPFGMLIWGLFAFLHVFLAIFLAAK